MTEANPPINFPTEQVAKQILHDSLGRNTKSIRRFPTGLANYVYEVETEDGDALVIRLARPDLRHFLMELFIGIGN